MMRIQTCHRDFQRIAFRLALTVALAFAPRAFAATAPATDWIDLFDGRSLTGWQASEHTSAWHVQEGLLIAQGERSHLFYAGPVSDHDFQDFELEVEARTTSGANSGIYFHTQFQEVGWPARGYEVQIKNSDQPTAAHRELKRTGSLYGVRNIYKSSVADDQWFRVRIAVVSSRVRVWVDDVLTVDYLEPEDAPRRSDLSGRRLGHGTIALQAHDPASQVAFRRVRIRMLSDDGVSIDDSRASADGYGLPAATIDRLSGEDIPLIDYHIHLRGGVTPQSALQRQAVTGMNCGVLKNVGEGWPIETDQQLQELIDSVKGMPLLVGLQVNDRDWMHRHAPELIEQLDYVLADTMIMPMPSDESSPVKLWIPENYSIADPEAWMQRYMRHNLRVLSEPISILANPTYLPPPLEDLYDQLWTDARMREVIQAALDNHVALEVNGSSQWPHERFIRLAKEMGATFSFGSNNFDNKPINMSRCLEAISQYGLTRDDMFVPLPHVDQTK